jgi:thiosulfate/3-mercaptopyruvate sulfurtransferase
MSVPLILSAKETARLAGNNSILLVDTRPFTDYRAGHIPKAVDLPMTEYHWSDTSPKGIRAFANHMERLLGFIGVTPNKHVVFYEETSGMMAARGVWLLHYLGHRNASMLDGGLRSWRKAGYKTTTEPTAPKPSRFKARVNPNVIATMNSVLVSLNNPNRIILDVRSTEEYDGTLVRAARAGHIPTARNLDWNRTLSKQGLLKPRKELERIYSKAGVVPDREIIIYCQAGYRAAHTYLVLKLLGYPNARNYLASWFEWGNTQKVPVEN